MENDNGSMERILLMFKVEEKGRLVVDGNTRSVSRWLIQTKQTTAICCIVLAFTVCVMNEWIVENPDMQCCVNDPVFLIQLQP